MDSELQQIQRLIAEQDRLKADAVAKMNEASRKFEQRRTHAELATVRNSNGERWSYSPELQAYEDEIRQAENAIEYSLKEVRFLEHRMNQVQHDAQLLAADMGRILAQELALLGAIPCGPLPPHIESKLSGLRERYLALVGNGTR